MPTAQHAKKAAGSDVKKETKAAAVNGASRKKVYALAGIAVIIIAIVGAVIYEYGGNASQNSSFLTFKSNFNSAPSVAIYAVGNNGSALSSTIGCSTQLLEQLIRSATNHRNASTIHYYVMNKTVCDYPSGVLGSGSGGTINTTPSACLALGSSLPRIFVNYSATNSTFITPTTLYLKGNAAFMAQCGIASEITSG